MPRTDKEIAAYIEYFRTAPREERAWALERLAKQEGKTPAEIREICENYKGTNLWKGVPAPDELYDRIQSQLRAGQSETQIMRDFGTSATTIAKAKQRMYKAEEKKPEPVEEEKPEPEGVYRQNFFENPPPEEREPIPPIVEEDVKTYLPGDVAGDCRKEIDWFDLLENIKKAAVGIFGWDVKINEVHASYFEKRAGISVKAGGKRYDIVVEEV